MRHTHPETTCRRSPLQHCLELAEPTPRFQTGTISRYRVCLVREESTPYDASEVCIRPEVAVKHIWPLVEGADREIVGALLLDTQGRAIGHHVAYVGTLTRAAVEPRGLLVPALLSSAAAMVLFHNHPIGDPEPSERDLDFTRLLVLGCEAVGLTLYDHLILAERPRYTSLRERGLV